MNETHKNGNRPLAMNFESLEKSILTEYARANLCDRNERALDFDASRTAVTRATASVHKLRSDDFNQGHEQLG